MNILLAGGSCSLINSSHDPETQKRGTQSLSADWEINIDIINMKEYLKNMSFLMIVRI